MITRMFEMQCDDAALCLLKVLRWLAVVCGRVREPLRSPPDFIACGLPVCTDLYWSLLDWLQFLEFHAAVHLLPFESAPFASRYTALAIPWAESSFPLLILLFTAGVDVSVSLTGWVAG